MLGVSPPSSAPHENIEPGEEEARVVEEEEEEGLLLAGAWRRARCEDKEGEGVGEGEEDTGRDEVESEERGGSMVCGDKHS